MRRVSRLPPGLALNLTAQGLTFAAMLLPVVTGRFEATAVLLIVSAVATLLTPLALFGLAGLAPGLRGRATVAAAARVAAMGLAGTVLLLAGAAVVAAACGASSIVGYLVGTAAMLLVSGGFAASLAAFIRLDDIRGLALTRIVYGVLLAASTVIAVTLSTWDFALVVANTLAMAGALVIVSAPRLGRRAVQALRTRLPRGSARAYASRALPAGAAGLVSGVAAQGGVFTVPLLPGIAGVWGSALRLTGGFATVGQQIVAPYFDTRVGRAARTRQDPWPSVRRAVLAGTALGLLAAAVTIASLWWGSRTAGLADPPLWLLAAVVVLVLSQSVLSVCERFALTLGARRRMLAWATVKLALTIVVLIVVRGPALVWTIVAVDAAMTAAYFLVVRAARRSRLAGRDDSGPTR